MTTTLHELDADIREAAMIEAIEAEGHAWDTFRHEDGSATLVMTDTDSYDANPRDHDGNVATLIQTNGRCIDIDHDVAGLAEARDRWDHLNYGGRGPGTVDHHFRETMMQRYVAMFRPDIEIYVDHWSAGDSHGWGYVLTDEVNAHLPDHLSAADAFDAEVRLYQQWADGDVYGYVHIYPTEPVVTFGAEGAYVSGWTVEHESCWGFLGYDNPSDIAAEATGSPLV